MNNNPIIRIGRVFTSADEVLAHTDTWAMDWLHRIVKRYAALQWCCGKTQCLLAVSVAWALAGEAAAGNEQVFHHIDSSIHLRQSMNDLVAPPDECPLITVQGRPLLFGEADRMTEHIMWDFYAVLIEFLAKKSTIQPFFFDVADRMQWKAYEGECGDEVMMETPHGNLMKASDEVLMEMADDEEHNPQSLSDFQDPQALVERIVKAMPEGQGLQLNLFFLGDVFNFGTITGNVVEKDF